MAKPHWQISTEDAAGNRTVDGYGCQHTTCTSLSTWQWQREATDAEIAAEANIQGPYGDVHRNPQGPHNTAVFSCDTHVFKNADGGHNLDLAATRHLQGCPAPDPGCECPCPSNSQTA